MIKAQKAMYLWKKTAPSKGIYWWRKVSRRKVIKLRHMVSRIVEKVNMIALAEPRVMVTPNPAICLRPDASFR